MYFIFYSFEFFSLNKFNVKHYPFLNSFFLFNFLISVFRHGECDYPTKPGSRVPLHPSHHDLQGNCDYSLRDMV